MPQPPALRRLRLPEGLTLDAAQKHVIAPSHTEGVELEEVDVRRERLPRRARRGLVFTKKPAVDVAKMGEALHAALKDEVAGYILNVRKDGKAIYNLQWKHARAPQDGNDAWNPRARMHVASVSKFLTAIGMVQALDDAKVSVDAKIAPHLPAYWSLGNKIDQITFRHLLTHTSGFRTGTSKSDFAFMKSRVAAGVSSVGSYDYENMNFGLCRILIPILRKEIDRDLELAAPLPGDAIWDATTIGFFRRFMQSRVFGPAGVKAVGFAPMPGVTDALAYRFPQTAAPGWNSGDLATMSGGAGFRLSLDELLDTMGAFRRGRLMSTGRAQEMLDGKFGIDQVIDTPAGKLYNKNGSWRKNGFREQSVAYFLPDGMELAVFVNSAIGTEDYSLRGLVKEAFEDSLVG